MRAFISIVIVIVEIFVQSKILPLDDNASTGFDAVGRYISSLIVFALMVIVLWYLWKKK